MKAKRILSIAIVSGIGLLGANTAFSQDATVDSITAINTATQQLAAGNVEAALQGFDSAAEVSDDNYTLNYNRGIALYRNGDIEAARSQFTEALDSTDSTLAAKSWFNLGNCDYATATEAAEQDRPAAIESLKGAISKYRRSLKLNSDDTDARANIELAAKLMNQLQQQEKQEQQQEQNEDQQQQDQQQSGGENSEQQDQSQQNQNQSGQQQNQDQQSQGQTGDDQQQDQQSEENDSEGQQSENEAGDQSQQNENQSQSESQSESQNESQSESQTVNQTKIHLSKNLISNLSKTKPVIKVIKTRANKARPTMINRNRSNRTRQTHQTQTLKMSSSRAMKASSKISPTHHQKTATNPKSSEIRRVKNPLLISSRTCKSRLKSCKSSMRAKVSRNLKKRTPNNVSKVVHQRVRRVRKPRKASNQWEHPLDTATATLELPKAKWTSTKR